MLNHIVIMGRLTRDPELRYTQTQTPVASFRLAVDRDFSGNNQERQTDFIDVVAWRKTAEFVSKYFQKGSMAIVSGRLQMREWTDRDNNRRTTAEVVADNVYFGESKRSREEGSYAGSSAGSGSYAPKPASGGFNAGYSDAPAVDSAFSELDDGDGDLPF